MTPLIYAIGFLALNSTSLAVCALLTVFGIQPEPAPNRLALSPSKKIVVVARDRNGVDVYSAETWRKTHVIPIENEVRIVHVLHDDTIITLDRLERADANKPVQFVAARWRLARSSIEKIWENRTFVGSPTSICSDPSGKYIVATSIYGYIYFLNAEDGRLVRTWQELGNGVSDSQFSPDGNFLITAGQSLRVWRAALSEIKEDSSANSELTEAERETFELDFVKSKLGWSVLMQPIPQAETFLIQGAFTGPRANCVAVFDSSTNKLVEKLQLEEFGSEAIACSPNGKLAVIAFADELRIVELPTLKPVKSYSDLPANSIQSIRFFDDHQILAASSAGNELWILEIDTGEFKKIEPNSLR